MVPWIPLPRVRFYPLVNVYKKLLKIAIEIVDWPINSMVTFNSYVTNYQREVPTHFQNSHIFPIQQPTPKAPAARHFPALKDGFVGKIDTGNHGFSALNMGVKPIFFPLNQSNHAKWPKFLALAMLSTGQCWWLWTIAHLWITYWKMANDTVRKLLNYKRV